MERVRIELQNVAKYYYSDTAVTQALRKVNLQFRMGEFVAITGESGSGKSTLLKVISGMEPFDDGELYVDGEPTFQYDEDDWEEHRRHRIGFVFQDYRLIGHYSAKENIVSALLIMGMPRSQAEEKAVAYLERVGLAGQCNQRASKLSSGQKQRLSIARALAKNTDIILTDEPTGNLDSETGEQIIKLLQNLSEDHLVIMVTHNYELVEKYVTRKIRLHDGEVILDVPVNTDEEQGKNAAQAAEGAVADEERGLQGDRQQGTDLSANWDISKKEERNQNRRLARIFAGLNAKTQPGKVALFLFFFLITATVSFMFIGQLLMNADDVFTREYSGDAFAKEDATRLSVRRKDGLALTEKDTEKMAKLSNVVSVDMYDVANDINYYYVEDEDFRREYGYANMVYEDEVLTKAEYEVDVDEDWTNNIEFLSKKRFMRSSSSLKPSDLAKGRLPENMYEIVVYDNGKTPLETEINMFFTSDLLWGSDGNYIFHSMKVVGLLKEKTEQIYFSPDYCQMLQSSSMFGRLRYEYAWNKCMRRYDGQAELIPILGEGLEWGEMRSSSMYTPPAANQDKGPKRLHAQTGIIHVMAYDENGNMYQVGDPLNYSTREKVNLHGAEIVEVPEDLYKNYIWQYSKQAAVYITSYAKTDKVIRQLSKQGYDAISTLRYGAGDYVDKLVQERLKLIAIAASVLFVLLLAEILILRSLMKIRIKDQYVMKFMGMRMKLMCKIGYVEIRRYCIFAIVAVMVGIHVLAYKIPMLREMLYYYEISGYLLFFAYNLMAAMLMVAAFNHLLRGRMDE